MKDLIQLIKETKQELETVTKEFNKVTYNNNPKEYNHLEKIRSNLIDRLDILNSKLI